jgi:RNA polymerase sigma factor (TIGR02999 family)
MRHVLVDHAKSRSRAKRKAPGNDLLPVGSDLTAPADVDVIALDEALERLSKLEPRMAQVIELRYFGGMTYDEIATNLSTSAATVHRDIRLARAWLLDEMEGESHSPG